MKKERLDVLLTNEGYYPSREKAKTAIMAGNVLVNEEKIDKPGTKVPLDAQIRLLKIDLPFVSRGGKKLAKALKYFQADMQGKIMIDIGASTGGFTDVALQNGAARVYAVDVGYGQLDWKLRQDERVIVLERTNARYLTKKMIPEQVDVITIDASFISLTKLLPNLKEFLKPEGNFFVLIKPQFEAGRDKIGKNGVVRGSDIHLAVIDKLMDFSRSIGLYFQDLTYSPIRGPKGNIEYLAWLQGTEKKPEFESKKIVAEAFSSLTEN